MLIRACCAGDVDLLEQRMPTRGGHVHARHFARQERGVQLYLIALERHLPAGSCVLRWDGWLEVEIRRALPDCPEITNLHVVQDSRGRGVGTALITAAEDRARAAGYQRIGIGVAEDNPEAARLYLRLGYRDTGLRNESRHVYPDENGVRRKVVEHNLALVKTLV